jgi:hypothetical protein
MVPNSSATHPVISRAEPGASSLIGLRPGRGATYAAQADSAAAIGM